MTPDTVQKLTLQLMHEEQYRKSAYRDSTPEGYLTIGYGRLIDSRKGAGISPTEAAYLLANDVAEKVASLAPFAWYSSQDEVRQAALADMAFNLGTEGLLHFPKFLHHMGAKEYTLADAELEGTPWEAQTGTRAARIRAMIVTGNWQE